MQKNYSIETREQYTVVQHQSKPDLYDMLSAIDEVRLTDTKDRRMWVFNDGLNLSSAELERIAEHANHTLKAPSKSAVVSAEDLAFGLLKIIEAHREQDGHEIRVFRDESKAASWINSV